MGLMVLKSAVCLSVLFILFKEGEGEWLKIDNIYIILVSLLRKPAP